MVRYFSFDLDNTLYDYWVNSTNAVEKALDHLADSTSFPRDKFLEFYINYIERIPGPQLFSDGRTSFEYRIERFSQILKDADCYTEELALQGVQIFSDSIIEGIKPFENAVEVIEEVSKQKKVLIITDAPRDIQQTLIEKLGINEYVDALFTPTESGMIKETGELFTFAMKNLDASPGDLIHFGDHYPRDILGARKVGIRSVLYMYDKYLPQDKDLETIHSLKQILDYL